MKTSRSSLVADSHGFTLVEVAAVVALLLLALLGFAATVTGGMDAVQLARENSEATQAARRTMERLQDYESIPFDEVFASYNEPDSDDPSGSLVRPGAHFAVRLPALDTDSDGLPGYIEFPTSDNGLELREDVAGRDLNADGVIDTSDHSGDYRLLPVIVRVQWRSRGRAQELTLQTILTNR